ncbi:MAG: alpha/beta hydrolase [Alphaproteobacteria bacterium]|nr:alpha/beta hydrolase [Alphaproteobacteria bacterium]
MNPIKAMSVTACLVLLAGCAASAALSENVITVKPQYGGELNFVLLKPDNPKAAVVLFAGGNGNLRLNDDGEISRKSFLIRNRVDFVDQGFMVAVFNPPSGMENLLRPYRMSEKHGQDIRAVVEHLNKTANVPVWLIGVSRGTYSAANGAIRLKGLLSGIILTSTPTKSRKKYTIYATHPNGVIDMELGSIKVPVLVVANKTDSCAGSPASNAEKLSKAFTVAPKTALIIFDGEEETKQDNCRWVSQHQYSGFEGKVVDAIADFIKASAK